MNASVGVRGASLIYPAILHSGWVTAMAFTLTSATVNPSAAYTSAFGFGGFGPVRLAAQGTAPHRSFVDIDYGGPRWGDYSAEAIDPANGTIWGATEYVGSPPGNSEPYDNWGTRIWNLGLVP